ncbi:SilA [Klebsiella pneumoniae]|uniref:SilA n=1 Tax=Klebsiella pneumoniae TaxID=573 RepID=A0A2X3C1J1_KLEPN|nr:SilA [Klebsiella pneumoniae]
MHFQGLNANIMSLGGIAIAVGAMVDAAIVMIEMRTNGLRSGIISIRVSRLTTPPAGR